MSEREEKGITIFETLNDIDEKFIIEADLSGKNGSNIMQRRLRGKSRMLVAVAGILVVTFGARYFLTQTSNYSDTTTPLVAQDADGVMSPDVAAESEGVYDFEFDDVDMGAYFGDYLHLTEHEISAVFPNFENVSDARASVRGNIIEIEVYINDIRVFISNDEFVFMEIPDHLSQDVRQFEFRDVDVMILNDGMTIFSLGSVRFFLDEFDEELILLFIYGDEIDLGTLNY